MVKNVISLFNKKCFIYLFTLIIVTMHQTAMAVVCEGEYALCTAAKCEPNPDNEKEALCVCTAQVGPSIGLESCRSARTVKGEKTINSRYYPVTSYLSCPGNKPWADCMDSVCTVDKENPAKAVCVCTIVKNKGKYVLASDSCNKSECSSGLYAGFYYDEVTQVMNNQGRFSGIKPKACK